MRRRPRPGSVVRYHPKGASTVSFRSSRSGGGERRKASRNVLTGLRRSADGEYQLARFSTTVAIPWPTPMHIVTRPYFALRRASAWARVARLRGLLGRRGGVRA